MQVLEKLEELNRRYEELNEEMTKPDVIADPSRFRKIAKEQSDLDEVIKTYRLLTETITQIDDLNQVARDVPNFAWPLLERFWPGALTVVLPKSPHLPVDVTAGRDFVAVRLPDHPLCLELVVKVGRPLAVTSANLSGQPSPTTAEEVAAQLGGRIPLILDGGPTATPHPSSIVDFSVRPPRLLREGDLSLQVLREVVTDLVG